LTRWESLDAIFKSLKWMRLRGHLAIDSQERKVLATDAAVIVQEKRRWDNRSEFEKDGMSLSTLVERYHHLECTNIHDKVYGLLGLSSDGRQLKVDYRKSPEKVCEQVLKVVYCAEGWAERTRALFGNVLRAALGLEKLTRAGITQEDVMQESESGSLVWDENSAT
jgi:hypothetical protein